MEIKKSTYFYKKTKIQIKKDFCKTMNNHNFARVLYTYIFPYSSEVLVRAIINSTKAIIDGIKVREKIK